MRGVLDDDEKIEGDDDEVVKAKPEDFVEASSSLLEDVGSGVAGLMAARGAWKTDWGRRRDCVNSVCFPMI